MINKHFYVITEIPSTLSLTATVGYIWKFRLFWPVSRIANSRIIFVLLVTEWPVISIFFITTMHVLYSVRNGNASPTSYCTHLAAVWSRSRNLSFEGDSNSGPHPFHLDLRVILLQSLW